MPLILFPSPVGRCGIAWRALGAVADDEGRALVTAVQLPERSDEETREQLARRSGAGETIDTPPPQTVLATINAIVALLDGQPTDLTDVAIDMTRVPPFARRVYDEARTIRPGQTRTYGEIAIAIGAPGASRAVGHALGRNPFPIIVPCHRVVAARGALGGFSAPGGRRTKRRLLEIEARRLDGM